MKCIVLVLCLAAAFVPAAQPDNGLEGPLGSPRVLYQGKSAEWWAKRAQQARRDANARATTIRHLRRELAHSPSVQEAVALALMVYPEMRPCDAWTIIGHESRGYTYAKNSRSSASGLYQFLDSTWRSTPYGRAGFSVFSPYAASLGAGWMHQQGRSGEWDIPRCS